MPGPSLFRPEVAAEVVAHLLEWSDGVRDGGTLLKMLYLAERRCLDELNWPMLFDEIRCLPHGIVPQGTYDLMQGNISSKAWDYYITTVSIYDVILNRSPRQEHLSQAQLEILREIYQESKEKAFSDLSQESHCLPEWVRPGESSLPLSLKEILRALNKSQEEIDDITEALWYESELRDILHGNT